MLSNCSVLPFPSFVASRSILQETRGLGDERSVSFHSYYSSELNLHAYGALEAPSLPLFTNVASDVSWASRVVLMTVN